MLVFNRRRPGETERMLISDFVNAKTVNFKEDVELFNYLDVTEKEAANEYLLVPLRGKLNRSVSAVVDRNTYKCLKTVILHRNKIGVKDKNPYVFGLPGGDGRECRHLEGCALLRHFAGQCQDLENPSSLRATLLRKHLATQCSVIGMEQNEIADVANHLGHAEQIHQEIYR